MRLLCSACLLGISCRFDGQSRPSQRILTLLHEHEFVPICPEQLGGLPTPRLPCERQSDGRIKCINGDDKTENYLKGAREALKIYQLTGCQAAILKSRSPACGKNLIYDGNFSRILIQGNGILAELLLRQGIIVMNDEDNFRVGSLSSL